MPDYSQQMPQYMIDQQSMLANQQGMFQNQTIYAAQSRMQANLQATLAGTMNAAMAASQGFASITKPFHEKIYNDLYFGNGQYALERSMTRDVLFGTGIAQSSFGRALQIGGRKPEFLDNAQFYHEMNRSIDLRKEELGDSLITGAASGLGMAASFIPGVGFIGGMAIDSTFGFAARAAVQRRQFSRDIREYSAITDLNSGAGQRRLSDSQAGMLSDSFIGHDLNLGQALPLIGDRFRPDTSYAETFKKMGQLGLLRDSNLNDISELEKTVKSTAKFIEQFAGLAKVTKDEALKLKATFNDMGINSNTAMNATLGLSYSTGIDVTTLGAIAKTGAFGGVQSGYGAGIGASQSFVNLAQVNALREGGGISRLYDPVSLSMERTQNEQTYGKSGLSLVTAFGGVSGGKKYLAGLGNGSVEYGLSIFKNNILGSNGTGKEFHDSLDAIYGMVRKNTRSSEDALAGVLNIVGSTPGVTPEMMRQAQEYLTGITGISNDQANKSMYSSRAAQLGISLNDTLFTMGDINNLKDLKSNGVYVSDKERTKYAALGIANRLLGNADNGLVDAASADKLSTSGDIEGRFNSSEEKAARWNFRRFANDKDVKSLMQKYVEAINSDDKAGMAGKILSQLRDKASNGFTTSDNADQFVGSLLKVFNGGKGSLAAYDVEKIRNRNFDSLTSGFDEHNIDQNAVSKIKNLSADKALQIMQMVQSGDTEGASKILGFNIDKNFREETKFETTDRAGNLVSRTGYINYKDALQSLISKDGLNNITVSTAFTKYADSKYDPKSGLTQEQFYTKLRKDFKSFSSMISSNSGDKKTFTSLASEFFDQPTADRLSRNFGSAGFEEAQKFLQNYQFGSLSKDQQDELSVAMDKGDNRNALNSLVDACDAIAKTLDPSYADKVQKRQAGNTASPGAH